MTANQRTSATAVGIGASRRRPDASAKVRGEFEYATDLSEEGMLWGATRRSPHPYARVLRVNLGSAKEMPGVHAVLGAWDVPDNRFGAINNDQPVLADDYVRYVGEPIAIVAADDRETAARAAAVIEIEFEPLVPITDPMDALAAGKIYRHVKYTHGDPSAVGEVQVEGEYFTARQDHSFMAPDAGLARPDGRGGVEVIGATQWVHADRAQIAASLGLPEEKVLVRNAGVGGSFGGRVSMTWQIHGALLALHTVMWTSLTPSVVCTVWQASVTNPCPTSAAAQSIVATPSRSVTMAVELTGAPSDRQTFLTAAASATPRRTCSGRVAVATPPGKWTGCTAFASRGNAGGSAWRGSARSAPAPARDDPVPG